MKSLFKLFLQAILVLSGFATVAFLLCGPTSEDAGNVCATCKLFARYSLAVFFISGGICHFIPTMIRQLYLPIMPPFLPFKKQLIYISGVMEAVAGGMMLVPEFTALGAQLILVILVLVYPANIYLALSPAAQRATGATPLLSWIRLPFQLLFAAWAYWFLV
jgi:uncharacterized membrane protein